MNRAVEVIRPLGDIAQTARRVPVHRAVEACHPE